MKCNQQIELSIIETANLGDGIAKHEGLPVYVPFAMAGDVVRVEIAHINSQSARAQLLEIISPSPHRQLAPCQYFGSCGGCNLQHLAPDYYLQLKQSTAIRVLKHLEQPLDILQPLWQAGAGARRRVEWTVRVNKGNVAIGYLVQKTHNIVAIESCLIATKSISALLAPLKLCLQSMKNPNVIASISVADLTAGIDMLVHVKASVKDTDKILLKQFAVAHNLVRLVLEYSELQNHETIYDNANAKVQFGEVSVDLPVGAFLQASESAQIAISEIIKTHLQGCKRVLDLYAGCGTYSFPLQMQSEYIAAYEGSPDMVAAMHNAINHHGLHEQMNVTIRDLFNQPLKSTELQHYDGVVINPPRNGALPQIKQLAQSGVLKIAMISCNPATFTRDAQYLIEAGYQLQSLTPIDQFVWSAHLELVGLFICSR